MTPFLLCKECLLKVILHFGLYLSQILMYFASIWLILNPVIIPIIGLVGSARTAVLILKSSKARAFKNAVFLQSLVATVSE